MAEARCSAHNFASTSSPVAAAAAVGAVADVAPTLVVDSPMNLREDHYP